MSTYDTHRTSRGSGALHVARSRGAMTGIALIVLGLWGALIPFFGPLADYAYTPDDSFNWTAGRFWMEVLPGAVAVLGGLCLLLTANRAVALFGGWLGAAAGAWFAVGELFGQYLPRDWGDAGVPVGGNTAQTVEQLGFFTGLGVVMVLVAGTALGRLSVRSVGDIEHAEQRRLDRTAAREAPAVVEPASPHRVDTHGEVYDDDPRLHGADRPGEIDLSEDPPAEHHRRRWVHR